MANGAILNQSTPPAYGGTITGDLLTWAKAQTGSICGFAPSAVTSKPSTQSGYAFVGVTGAGGWSLLFWTPSTQKFYYNSTSEGNWVGWSEVSTAEDLANYLPLAGGMLTGNLIVSKASYPTLEIKNTTLARQGLIQMDQSGAVQIFAQKDRNNRSVLTIATEGTTLEKLLCLQKVVERAISAEYLVYGTHNITSGTTDLVAGVTPLTTDAIHFVYE